VLFFLLGDGRKLNLGLLLREGMQYFIAGNIRSFTDIYVLYSVVLDSELAFR